MIDIHTHILPGIDDGSPCVDMSLAMLREEKRQGVSAVVLTPHFYAFRNSPEEFLDRRNRAWQQLLDAWTPDLPELHLGAEVRYYEGICQLPELSRLCMDGGETLLLEMPFSPWSRQMVRDILELEGRSRVILAHIERYFSFAPGEAWQLLREQGVAMQCNASFFLNWKTRRKALGMYRRGEVDFLASDCHNLTTRPPELGPAWEYIRKNTKQSK